MRRIPLFKIYWDDKDLEAVTNALKAGMNWATGPNIGKFEKMISAYVGTKYCVVFNSGTSALHAALLAYGFKQNDEIIVPSFTFIATSNAPIFVGAKPVFSDVEEETLGLNPEDVKERVSNKTKAILPIHYGGLPCKIRELREIADDYNLILIEDAAESFGAKIGSQKTGTFGDSAILSFAQNKIITTGEGGAILTNSKEIYEKSKLIRSHGRAESSRDFSIEVTDHVTLGYNIRMSNIVAALGISQLEKADKLIEMRRKNAEYYTKRLRQEVKEVITPRSPKDYYHVYQMYTIRTTKRDNLMRSLADKGIMTKVYFHSVHLNHFYKNVLRYKCKLPVTEEISKQVLTLPMWSTLTNEEIDYIVGNIKNFKEG